MRQWLKYSIKVQNNSRCAYPVTALKRKRVSESKGSKSARDLDVHDSFIIGISGGY